MWWRGILEDCADKQLHRRTRHPRTKGYPVAFEVYRACGMEPQDLIAAKFGGSKRRGGEEEKTDSTLTHCEKRTRPKRRGDISADHEARSKGLLELSSVGHPPCDAAP